MRTEWNLLDVIFDDHDNDDNNNKYQWPNINS